MKISAKFVLYGRTTPNLCFLVFSFYYNNCVCLLVVFYTLHYAMHTYTYIASEQKFILLLNFLDLHLKPPRNKIGMVFNRSSPAALHPLLINLRLQLHFAHTQSFYITYSVIILAYLYNMLVLR